MVDESQADLKALRARVYGRSEADPADVARLVALENSGALTAISDPPVFEGAQQALPGSIELSPPEPTAIAPGSLSAVNGRRILVATVTVVAVGGFVAGLLAGALPSTAERALAVSTTTASEPPIELPEEFTSSYLRVATWWQWDVGALRFGGAVDGAAIWVGTLDDLSEVCMVFDEGTSATILCNPAGEYPSSFEWIKSTAPSPGMYRLTLEQTGEVGWTFEPTA